MRDLNAALSYLDASCERSRYTARKINRKYVTRRVMVHVFEIGIVGSLRRNDQPHAASTIRIALVVPFYQPLLHRSTRYRSAMAVTRERAEREARELAVLAARFVRLIIPDYLLSVSGE